MNGGLLKWVGCGWAAADASASGKTDNAIGRNLLQYGAHSHYLLHITAICAQIALIAIMTPIANPPQLYHKILLYRHIYSNIAMYVLPIVTISSYSLVLFTCTPNQIIIKSNIFMYLLHNYI